MLSTRGIGNEISCFSCILTLIHELFWGGPTFSGRSCFRGLDFGVEVKTGNLVGRRSGDIEQLLGAGEFGGETESGSRDEARGGRFALRYTLGGGFVGVVTGEAATVGVGFGGGVDASGLVDIRLRSGFVGVIGCESGI